jgi:DNA-binding response OmpR family regulator
VEYIIKPFAPDELVHRVRDILKRYGYKLPSS